MGFGVLSKLQMRGRGENGRLHNSFQSPVPPSKWDTLGLAALDDDTVDWLQTTALCI